MGTRTSFYGPKNSNIRKFSHPLLANLETNYQYVALGLFSTIVCKERGMAVEALIQDDANALLIASSIIFGALTSSNHFWRHVLAGSDD